MIRTVLFIIWLIAGFCLIGSGCRGVLSAEKLEASLVIASPGYPLPESDEKILKEPNPQNRDSANGNQKPGN